MFCIRDYEPYFLWIVVVAKSVKGKLVAQDLINVQNLGNNFIEIFKEQFRSPDGTRHWMHVSTVFIQYARRMFDLPNTRMIRIDCHAFHECCHVIPYVIILPVLKKLVTRFFIANLKENSYIAADTTSARDDCWPKLLQANWHPACRLSNSVNDLTLPNVHIYPYA